MTTIVTERVLIDTNVVVSAFDPHRADHARARYIVESDLRDLAVAHQSLREFLAIMTRPLGLNGYGFDGRRATTAWHALTATVSHLAESQASQALLMSLVGNGLASGKQVHDANLVAVALDHGATTLITANPRHFNRFSHLITIESLS